MAKVNWIPKDLYGKIVERMPIPCVDVVLMKDEKYVLVKRAQEPLKGEWWPIGGRMHKNESVLECAHRKVLEEANLEAYNFAIIGVYEDFYETSSHDVPTHSVSIVVSAETNHYKPTVDETSSDIGLFNELPHRFLTSLTTLT